MLPRILYSAASFCSSHLPFFSQCRQSCGWLARISSRMVLRALRTFGELVVMSPASSTRLLQAVFKRLLQLSSTRHTRQKARTPKSGWWQRDGMLMPILRAASIMVVPDGTVTGIPSILIVTILFGSICILVTILSAIQTNRADTLDVSLKFFSSVFQAGIQCGASRLTQTAGGSGCHREGQPFHPFKILFCCKSVCKTMQNHIHLTVSFTTGNTFSTAFMDKKF